MQERRLSPAMHLYESVTAIGLPPSRAGARNLTVRPFFLTTSAIPTSYAGWHRRGGVTVLPRNLLCCTGAIMGKRPGRAGADRFLKLMPIAGRRISQPRVLTACIRASKEAKAGRLEHLRFRSPTPAPLARQTETFRPQGTSPAMLAPSHLSSSRGEGVLASVRPAL